MPEVLGAALGAMVASNHERIAHDFPHIAKRYATLERAEQSVAEVINSIATSKGTFAAFAVQFNGQVIGAATLLHKALIGRGYQSGRTLIEGPLFALWLGGRKVRPPAVNPLMPGVLRLLAQEVRHRGMSGTPWTLVRPKHTHSISCLTNENNGFGGFYAPRHLSDYSRVDGVTELRVLYIPNGAQLRE